MSAAAVPSARTVGLALWELRVALIAWGLLAAVVTAIALDHRIPSHPVLMGMREDGIRDSLAELNRGGPPLLGTHGRPYPGDDSFGLYLYAPLIAHWLGSSDPLPVVKWILIVSMCLLPLVYPLVFRGIFGRAWIGMLAAFAPVVWFGFVEDPNTYWGPGWSVLLCIPLLLLLDRRWGPGWRPFAALGGIMLLASYASSIRAGSSLPILLVALLVMLRHARGWRGRSVGVVVAVVCTVVISTGVLAGARTYRNHVAHGPIKPELHSTIWHNVYIGFGYLANPWGIHYLDESAYAAAVRANPHVSYLGPGYGATLRHLVVRLVVDHPGFVARTVYMKSVQACKFVTSHFPWVLLLLPALLATGIGSRRLRRDTRLILVAAAVNLLQIVGVMPLPSYAIGWIAAWGLLGLVVLGHALVHAPAVGGRVWQRRSDPVSLRTSLGGALADNLRSPLVVGVTALMIGVAALSRVTITGLDVQTPTGFYTNVAAPLVAPPHSDAAAVASWSFDGRTPTSWQIEQDVRQAPAPAAVDVTTSTVAQGYQLLSPVIHLKPGVVSVYVDGSPESGGITIGLLSGDGSHWLGTASYWDGQTGFDRRRMAVTVHLDKRGAAKVVLANLEPADAVSHWRIQKVVVHDREDQ